jgi:RNA polymerase sigma-70 factor, ECF subfamily
MAFAEKQLAQSLALNDETIFEQVFKTHFKNLHAYSCSIVHDDAAAEGVVQNVFLKLWEQGSKLNIQPPIAAYLYRAVHNESCNYLKHQKVKQSYIQYARHTMSTSTRENASGKLIGAELEEKIRKVLTDLPEQCRTIFQMSRFEELKYRQIADKLGLSVKTVEAQMGKALKILRVKLADYLPYLLFFINL